MEIKIKKIHSDAKIPFYQRKGDAGMDIYAVSKIKTDKFIEYGSGLSFELPEGYVGFVFPRSSVSDKDLMMKFSVGVLDSGFRGELKLRFIKLGEEEYEIGDRVGQIIILPYPKIEFKEVEELSSSERGQGGLGSTGIK